MQLADDSSVSVVFDCVFYIYQRAYYGALRNDAHWVDRGCLREFCGLRSPVVFRCAECQEGIEMSFLVPKRWYSFL